MSTKTNTNDQARKSLADQIDRLDAVLDGLADGLNDAVSTAVKDAVGLAVQQAVQAVMREALANPELLSRLGAAAAPAPAPIAPAPAAAVAPKTTWTQRWASVPQTLASWAAAVRTECGRRLGQVRRWAAGAWDRLRFLTRIPYLLLTAVAVGVTAGVAACFARPWWCAAVGGVGRLTATTALYVQTAWRRLTTPAMALIG